MTAGKRTVIDKGWKVLYFQHTNDAGGMDFTTVADCFGSFTAHRVHHIRDVTNDGRRSVDADSNTRRIRWRRGEEYRLTTQRTTRKCISNIYVYVSYVRFGLKDSQFPLFHFALACAGETPCMWGTETTAA